MILRRFMQHVKQQNWFAVGLDVVVVIVGIFLGLQVQEWNQKRTDRAEEYNYLVKLHADASQLIADAEPYTNSRKVIADNLTELSMSLIDEKGNRNFTRLHCNAVGYSHIYVNRIVSLPTLNELLSSGQLLLIQDEKIKLLISKFDLAAEKTDSLLKSLQADKLELSRKYPKVVKLKSILVNANETFGDLQIECDFQEMAINEEFQNDLIGNTGRYINYVSNIFGQLAVLRELHNELEIKLNIID